MKLFFKLVLISLVQGIIYSAILLTAPIIVIGIIGPMCIIGQAATEVAIIILSVKPLKSFGEDKP
jgi:hypothetical protein